MIEKAPLLHINFVVLSDAEKKSSGRNCLFLKNYITLEGAVSHNVFYHQQLSIARCQVRFYAC